MMRTGHHIDQDLGLRRILHRRLQHTDDGGSTRIEPNGPADHGRIALQRVLPETISQHTGAGSIRTIVVLIKQPSQHGAQAHHLEVRAVDHAGLPAFDAFAKGIRSWQNELLGYFDEPTTNGYAEGVINKVKVIKRRAYGLPTFTGFRKRVVIACG